jgi:cytochrome P450
MTVEYDPYSDAAMADPFPAYRAMRAEGCPHFIEGRKAWALTRFEDVWKASLNEGWLDYTRGQTPGQLLLGEPCPVTFMTMNVPDHRHWRGVLTPFYTPDAAAAEAPRIRKQVREILGPLAAVGSFDVYRDFANRVMCRNAGYNLGFTDDQAEHFRALIDEMLHREPGQVGAGSARNQAAAGQLFGALAGFVGELRSRPERAVRQTKALLEAVVDGRQLSDQDLTFYLFSLLVTGSETTPLAVASTLALLARHPEQKAAVLADRSLIPQAFRETLRLYQPTNMLARRARTDFELGGSHIAAGDNLLFIYASANRDETRFADAERFDIHRAGPRDLSFGIGGHVCLGANLAPVAAHIMLEELLAATGDYELVEGGCEKSYGEFLLGFTRVPIKFAAKRAGTGT